MILTCPECRTRYQADAAQFPQDGRKVRCAKCSHVWHQPAPEAEPDISAVPAVIPETAEPAIGGQPGGESDPPARRRSWSEFLGLMAGWATLGAILVLIGWTGYRFREQIATLWPQSTSLFATFGVSVNAHGLAIDGTSWRRETDHGAPVWVVTGKLVNRSSHEISIPPVRVALTGIDAQELHHWTVRPPQRMLKPGQSVGFSARISSPPSGARQVQLGFAGQD